MTKLINTAILCILISYNAFGQEFKNYTDKNQVYNIPSFDSDDSKIRGIPSQIITWNSEKLFKSNDSYIIKFKSKTEFTCFGLGWKSDDNYINPAKFKINYQEGKNLFSVKNSPDSIEWGKIYNTEGEYSPSETSQALYWTDLLFIDDEKPCHELVFELIPPAGIEISEIRLDIMNYSVDIDSSHSKQIKKSVLKSACPQIPPIITRDEWCEGYTACSGATYTPTPINPSHVVIHHGGSPNNYTDAYALVRSYWNYHVNSLGWSDIGYNYLVDKYGNLFQGRKNDNMPYSDVQGAHVGNTNSYAIGVCFLGNSDSIVPTNPQLDITNQFLAWWFQNKGFTPGSVANIVLQSGGTADLPRICGHRDINVNATICPGDTLYLLLSSIISNTQAMIDACDQTGIKEQNDEQWQIFPNPAKNEIFINSSMTFKECKIEIYSENGYLVRTLFNRDLLKPINITDLDDGLYLLKISFNHNSKIFKFLKKT
jgi:hypothetical protein